MWEIEISIFSIDLDACQPSHPPVLPPSPTVTHSFSNPGHIYPTVRVGNMRVQLLRITPRRVSPVGNVIAGRTGRLHHTKSGLLDELMGRGLVDQVTR